MPDTFLRLLLFPCLRLPVPQLGEDIFMSRLLIIAVTILTVASLSACGTIGKGKGKAPPPAESTAVYK
jgi:hypothetical protein